MRKKRKSVRTAAGKKSRPAMKRRRRAVVRRQRTPRRSRPVRRQEPQPAVLESALVARPLPALIDESNNTQPSIVPASSVTPARVLTIDDGLLAAPDFERVEFPRLPEAGMPLPGVPVATQIAANADELVAVASERLTAPIVEAVASPAAEFEVHDLFDAQGRLVLPPGKMIAEAAGEPTLRSPEPGRSVMDAASVATIDGPQPVIPVAAADVSELTLPVATRPGRINGLNALSLAGVLRLALWPVKALYWPVRLAALRRRRKILENRYQPAELTGDLAPSTLALTMPARLNLGRLTLQFTVACVLFLMPLQIAVYYQDVSDAKDRLLAGSMQAIAALRLGKAELGAFRLASASVQFRQAEAGFQQVRAEYVGLNFFTKAVLQAVPQGRRALKAGLQLLDAGQSLAQLGGDVASELAQTEQAGTWSNWPALISTVNKFHTGIIAVLPAVANAKTALNGISAARVPVVNREQFLQAQKSLPEIEDALLDTAVVTDAVLRLTGAEQWQRYLVLFQNNAELRATGGFIGSYALLDVGQGEVVNLEVPAGGSYDLQGNLLALIAAPEPLQVINPRWEFHDANWWPEFSASAKKLAWFLEQSRGGSVDGVIALTNTTVERILRVLGPISLPAYGRVIDAENFTSETQKIVELEYDRTANRPKQFIADLAPLLLERIGNLTGDQQRKLAAVLYQSLKEKQLLLWNRDLQVQQIFEELDWAGAVQPTGLSDYLMVVNTNVAGGKTDRAVSTSLRHTVTVESDSQLVVSLTITRTHQGQPGDPFTGVVNNSFIRVYVPAGSRLISSIGFALPDGAVIPQPDPVYRQDADLEQYETDKEQDAASGVTIYRESGKTVFGHWISVKPGEQKSATLTYRLPFRLSEANNTYTLLAQKQPGSLGDELLSSLRIGTDATFARAYPEAGGDRLRISDGVVQFHDQLITDTFYGVVLQPSGSVAAEAN